MGWRAAELLAEQLAPGTAEITGYHQLTPEVALTLVDTPVVVFLDAAVDDVPGRVRYQHVHPQKAGAWSHHLSPGQLLSVAEQINGVAPPAVLISGGVLDTNFSDRLTPQAEQCAARMAAMAKWVVAKWNPAEADNVHT